MKTLKKITISPVWVLRMAFRSFLFIVLPLLILSGFSGNGSALAEGILKIGWAMEDITPDGPVSLRGQYYERISTYVQSPLKVTAIAIESNDESGHKEQAVMVSLDVINIQKPLQDAIKKSISEKIPGFDVDKLFLNATHTHSAPNPDVDSEYGKLLVERSSRAVVQAWNSRKPAGISRALGYTSIGHNRRVQYTDGTSQMYGSTDREDFLGMEGSSDSGVDMLYCWDFNNKLTGIIVNVSCPAQVTEAKYFVSADYWGELRREMANRFSEDVLLFPLCGAGGDISPRDLPRGYKSGEPNMWDVDGAVEIGKRLAGLIDDTYPDARKAIKRDIIFNHTIRHIDLPTRKYTVEEYEEALMVATEIRSREPVDSGFPSVAWNNFLNEIKENEKTKEYGPWDNKLTDWGQIRKKEALIAQYKNQENDPYCDMELHVIRLGDVAFASNPFELYVDYGFRIKGRSKAKQTFIIQLCSGQEGYLPTKKGILGGGYSAMVNRVGPEGGQVLVNKTVEEINVLWE